MISRITLGVTFLLFFFNLSGQNQRSRADQVIAEKQPVADQGNGYYLNPILAGNYGDPSIVRVGEDYYLAFSRGDGFILWHSRDLVNWAPIVRHHFPNGFERVWAVDLQYVNGRFQLYIPVMNYPGKEEVGFGNFVTVADRPEGPWSEPIRIEIPKPEDNEHWGAIDPGFIQTPDGEKYLYVSQGYVIALDDTGTQSVGLPQKVYDGWPYPDSWNVQCFCLESPKLFYREGFYYLVSAEGGTNGPSTAHMTVVARSESPTGPWINSPYNPLTHTYAQDEKWWHQGHGTVFEAADGSWWTIYHGRLNNFTGIGRQVLLMPVEWTPDGWPVVKDGLPSSDLLPKPAGENVGHGLTLSDDFTQDQLGMQWRYEVNQTARFKTGTGQLRIQASGENHRDGTLLEVGAVNRSFEVQVSIELPENGTLAGMALANDGVTFDGKEAYFTEGPNWRIRDVWEKVSTPGLIHLKIKNFRKDISMYYSNDGENWISFGKGLRLEDSYTIRLFAAGKGEVVFRNFTYRGLE